MTTDILQNMSNNEPSTEKLILEPAEAEFLEKGYAGAKMLSIAKRANVSHSMLHYYYRSKENLFQQIFQRKVQIVSAFMKDILVQNNSFTEIIRNLVETHFDFIAQNPKLPYFILTEILSNTRNREAFLEIWLPNLLPSIPRFTVMLKKEIEQGRIRAISVLDLLLNIISINVMTFIATPILQESISDPKVLQDFQSARKESNARFILASLRP